MAKKRSASVEDEDTESYIASSSPLKKVKVEELTAKKEDLDDVPAVETIEEVPGADVLDLSNAADDDYEDVLKFFNQSLQPRKRRKCHDISREERSSCRAKLPNI